MPTGLSAEATPAAETAAAACVAAGIQISPKINTHSGNPIARLNQTRSRCTPSRANVWGCMSRIFRLVHDQLSGCCGFMPCSVAVLGVPFAICRLPWAVYKCRLASFIAPGSGLNVTYNLPAAPDPVQAPQPNCVTARTSAGALSRVRSTPDAFHGPRSMQYRSWHRLATA